MKKINLVVLVWLTIIATLFIGCKDDEKPADPILDAETGNVTLYFGHVFGNPPSPFALNTTYVQPMTGDTVTFTLFKYYISNVAFQAEDDSWWIMPESYFLVDAADENYKLEIPNVPVKKYKAVRFLHGVDSARNTTGAQDGALATSNDMFWSWSNGYIMLKAEGKSPQSSTGTFTYHLGGFSGTVNVLTTRTLAFGGSSLNVEKSNNPKVYVNVNAARLWHSAGSMTDSAPTAVHTPGEKAKQLATDLFTWTRFDRLEN